MYKRTEKISVNETPPIKPSIAILVNWQKNFTQSKHFDEIRVFITRGGIV